VFGDVLRCVDRLIQRDEHLAQLINFLHEHDETDRLGHYTGHDVHHLLHLLSDQPVTSSGHPRKTRDSRITPVASGDRDVSALKDTSPRKPNVDLFLRAARGLHYVSIAILSFLLLEVQFVTVVVSSSTAVVHYVSKKFPPFSSL